MGKVNSISVNDLVLECESNPGKICYQALNNTVPIAKVYSVDRSTICSARYAATGGTRSLAGNLIGFMILFWLLGGAIGIFISYDLWIWLGVIGAVIGALLGVWRYYNASRSDCVSQSKPSMQLFVQKTGFADPISDIQRSSIQEYTPNGTFQPIPYLHPPLNDQAGGFWRFMDSITSAKVKVAKNAVAPVYQEQPQA